MRALQFSKHFLELMYLIAHQNTLNLLSSSYSFASLVRSHSLISCSSAGLWFRRHHWSLWDLDPSCRRCRGASRHLFALGAGWWIIAVAVAAGAVVELLVLVQEREHGLQCALLVILEQHEAHAFLSLSQENSRMSR
jgi:hypothetical protein